MSQLAFMVANYTVINKDVYYGIIIASINTKTGNILVFGLTLG